jgi:hypothetical protein
MSARATKSSSKDLSTEAGLWSSVLNSVGEKSIENSDDRSGVHFRDHEASSDAHQRRRGPRDFDNELRITAYADKASAYVPLHFGEHAG